jgi:Mn-dependent DtxR family transcriptional regulator
VTALTREIMTLQAEGDYAKAKNLLDRLGIVRPEVQKVLDRLAGVPVDIEPRFTSAETRQ